MVDRRREFGLRQPLGVLEQHRSELPETLADTPVAVGPREHDRLRRTEPTREPRALEPVDGVDCAGQSQETVVLGARPVERGAQLARHRAMSICGMQTATTGDRDRCGQFCLGRTPTQLECLDAVSQSRFGQGDQLLDGRLGRDMIFSNTRSFVNT